MYYYSRNQFYYQKNYYFIAYLTTVDCKWDVWGDWTKCSKDCGGGRQSRIRTELAVAANLGEQCVGDPRDERGCNIHNCPGLFDKF